MRQLNGFDSAFLFMETPNAPMHIGSVAIFDPSTAPGKIVRLKRIIKTLEERAHLAPYLKQRLVEVPFNADFPYWIRDKSFDPEFHIRHIALPKPGDWRQLCIQIARLHSRPLDRSKPLWELYVIEGLDNVEGIPPGSFAFVTKTHHAAIDGTSNYDAGSAMCDPTPEIRKIPPDRKWEADPYPSALELSILAQKNSLMRPQRYLEFLQKTIPSWSKSVEALSSSGTLSSSRVPRTRFNAVVSQHRVFEGATFQLDEIRDIKNRVGATVNDVVVAICAGAMRRYLLSKDELPEESLVTMCPISVRDPKTENTDGNQVVSMTVPLHTDIADPAERLRAITNSTKEAKEFTRAVSARSMLEAANFIPTQLSVLGARVAAEQGLANFVSPVANTVITNVPGSPVPFYSNGALFVRGWGLGPSVDGNGLFHSVGSYCGEVCIGITCCRDMMPDPEFYADCLVQSAQELTKAFGLARSAESRTGAPAPDTPPTKTAVKKTAVTKKVVTKKVVKKTTRKKRKKIKPADTGAQQKGH
jgi:WS/DGAT/MGAT family acyltransferase